jgi:hypothetical protein
MKNIENNFPAANTLAILHFPTIEHFFYLVLYFFQQCIKYVVLEAEGGGPKPFTRLIKYGIDQ